MKKLFARFVYSRADEWFFMFVVCRANIGIFI